MKTPIIPILSATALAVVSCTSLPGDISAGIKNGNPHAYYEAGKHIDDSKTAGEAPPLLQLVCLPINIPLAILSAPRMESCFFYRNHDSKNKEAAEYYRKGAELGDADCMYEMGRNYEKGWGVEENATIAWSYYTQAAQKGSSAARNKVAAQSPASIKGKTFSFSAPYSLGYRNDGSTYRDDAYTSRTIVWKWGNKSQRKDLPYSDDLYEYTKTGARTAELIEVHSMSDGYARPDFWRLCFTLHFETPTSGTCDLEVTGRYATIGADKYTATGRFTLK